MKISLKEATAYRCTKQEKGWNWDDFCALSIIDSLVIRSEEWGQFTGSWSGALF